MDNATAVIAIASAVWGVGMSLATQHSTAPKDLENTHKFIVRTCQIHRARLLKRLLQNHMELQRIEPGRIDDDGDFTSIVQQLDQFRHVSARATRVCTRCRYLRLLIFLSIACAIGVLLVGLKVDMDSKVAYGVVAVAFVIETVAGAILYLLAERLRKMAASDLIAVGFK
jgi:hypothetical protein